MNIIVATQNNGKTKEIKQIMAGSASIVLSLKDLQYDKDIAETGSSFCENALIKARAVEEAFGKSYPGYAVLADDSGLEADSLDGRPGIYSARYAGENSTQDALIGKVLDEMKNFGAGQRRARFYCVMVLIYKNGVYQAAGECRGTLGFEPRGGNGFGYDPIFLPEEYHGRKTMAELTDDEKNEISHRSRALAGIREIILKLNEGTGNG